MKDIILAGGWGSRLYPMTKTTSNCSNTYGPKQQAEKLTPTIIRKCLAVRMKALMPVLLKQWRGI